MEGLVTAYSGTTLTINIDTTNGSGTLASWNINVAGNSGVALDGVISGGAVTGSGTSGTHDLPNNCPMFSNQAILARSGGLEGRMIDNTVVGLNGDTTFSRIDTYIFQTPGVFNITEPPGFDTLVWPGTASASPVPGPLPAGSLPLAYITVPPGATDSSQCTITDARVFVPSWPVSKVGIGRDWRVADHGSGDITVQNATIALSLGTVFDFLLTTSTTISVVGTVDDRGLFAVRKTVIVRQDGVGGHTLSWPASVKWPAGSTPTLSAGSNAVDIFEIVTVDAGTTWYGYRVGANY
jgi:hypothetical protein